MIFVYLIIGICVGVGYVFWAAFQFAYLAARILFGILNLIIEMIGARHGTQRR